MASAEFEERRRSPDPSDAMSGATGSFDAEDEASDDQDQSHESEGEKNATAEQEGSEEEIGKGKAQGSETLVGGSLSEADVQEETPSLDVM
ncbi:hypothetical protein NDU88_000769 [Pleurodeles waltl]|uniref:Uncharacterized protein n=1 Tax=Pleurodeles waltl TaxID=8319 RepID=A0AAV7WJZ0_PLEWA|nr:hypothetical protein NDU88_000769 [Pleurodeles waltl]